MSEYNLTYPIKVQPVSRHKEKDMDFELAIHVPLQFHTSISSSSLAFSPLSIFLLKYSGQALTSSAGKNVRLAPCCVRISRVRQLSMPFAASMPEAVTPAAAR